MSISHEIKHDYSTVALPTTALAPRQDAIPTAPLVRPTPYVLDILAVAIRLLICLAAIYMGILIAVNGPNQGTAVLAAFACAAVIYGLLSPKRTPTSTTTRVYRVWGMRLRGDEDFDRWVDRQ